MVESYELYLILNPQLSEPEIDNKIKAIQEAIEAEVQGQEIESEKEGLKTFAYPIKKSWNGYYLLINFEVNLDNTPNVPKLERRLSQLEGVWRFLLTNITQQEKLRAKENRREQIDFSSHREFNRGRRDKKCYINYLGLQTLDYKDSEFLSQFMTPYAKILPSRKTGTTSKNQRKVKKAIKRARYMGLLPFSTKHMR
jgi:small subunit ribosomal protein S18